MENTKQYPTEILDLPSKGYFYPEENPLSKGTIEIKYMTAKEEDILTSTNLVKKGLAIDMVLRSVIVSPIDYDTLLIGDKNAVMVATRILAYGKDYAVDITCPACEKKSRRNVDLSALQHKEISFEKLSKGVNEFELDLPSGAKITFKFLTSGDEKLIDADIKGLKKLNSIGVQQGYELSTRLKYVITSVNGVRDKQSITSFVDNKMLASDSLALRRKLAEIQPDVDMTFDYTCDNPDCGYEERMVIPLTVEFFWPRGAR